MGDDPSRAYPAAVRRGCWTGRYGGRTGRFGKPLETMGRKVQEAVASEGNRANPSALCQSGCDSKPRETVGRQSYGG